MDFTLRPTTLSDLELHVHHRVVMFADMDYGDEAGRERMAASFRDRLRTWLSTGEVRGVIAESDGRVVAGALLQFKEMLPNPLSPQAVRGYLFNVYTDPEFRSRGLARRMTIALLDLAKAQGIGMVELHASRHAEPLYRSMGFEPTSEFRLILDEGIQKPGQWVDRR
ncbi:MAG: GNAT family N-acetyltransferase [Holophagaceae bacterium]|nr:GNAT family N-acetyltransferase [Holophagaceae bacterium]